MDEEWEVVSSFLPEGWRELARETGALKGLRKDKSVDALLRTLLLHLACGHSLRETVVRARKANLADLSDVALLKRLRKSGDWLHALCVALFREQGMAMSADGDTAWRRCRPHSAWRDFRFMLNQVVRAIEPHLSLAEVIDEWNQSIRPLSG